MKSCDLVIGHLFLEVLLLFFYDFEAGMIKSWLKENKKDLNVLLATLPYNLLNFLYPAKLDSPFSAPKFIISIFNTLFAVLSFVAFKYL